MILPHDVWLFKEGTHYELFNVLGVHRQEQGFHFAVWAPNAASVFLMGDFNGWNPESCPLEPRKDHSGIWEGDVREACSGQKYKYHIVSHHGRYHMDKGDPFAFYWEQPPGNSSVVWDLDGYIWNDAEWRKAREKQKPRDAPMAIYEVHLPSWRRVPEENNRSLSYLELAHYLPSYVKEMGFTHVEFLPIMEHPFYGSWGYQTTGYYAPSSRYGTPQDFMALIDSLHQHGIGVILDLVPSHFPSDAHGLAYFDGTHLYEHEDARKRIHPDWHTYMFNYEYPAIQSFLISSACFWFEKYHIDALRIDAVSSMLYLNFSKKEGEWLPNMYGGKENLGAIDFLQKLNQVVYARYPYAEMIAEEATDWASVSRPTYTGGLGFGMKWNMGWMHDILFYMSLDPIFRKFHHNTLLFSIHYAFTENFILPLSHDEVVYGKRSLLSKMPGSEWEKFANLRLLFGYMYAHPGKKLLFMGGEIGQYLEWNHEASLDWHLLEYPLHKALSKWVKDLNQFYKNHKELYEKDFNPAGFEWVDVCDWEKSIISFMRGELLVVCNFTPVPRFNYRIGVSREGSYRLFLNSDESCYGGSHLAIQKQFDSLPEGMHGRPFSLSLTLPPLAILFFTSRMS
jgi:1,4-alpha-glucan branching enzyme